MNAERSIGDALGQGRQPCRLLATGDICPSHGLRLDEAFSAGRASAEAVYGDVLPELAEKDISVANLELPLSDRGQALIKDGPALRGPPAAIEGLLAGRFDVVDLANNHTLDFGPDALLDTIALLKRHGIVPLGAGADLETARRPVFLDRGGLRAGLLAFAENEFSIASRSSPGAAPLNPGPNCVAISAARPLCNLLVVFVHGGNEYCPFPSPRMVRDYRSFVDAGADAVIGHHAHTVQGVEWYRGVPILYNIGNFLFWVPGGDEGPLWWHGMVPRLSFIGRRCAALDVLPTWLDPRTARLSLLNGQRKAAFLQRLHRLSQIIADAELHERFWKAYCAMKLPSFLERIRASRAGIDLPDSRRQSAALLRNLFGCEAHHEAIFTALELMRGGQERATFGVEEELSRLMAGEELRAQ
jgi:hypothetical protein